LFRGSGSLLLCFWFFAVFSGMVCSLRA
jgi:hypothetical protein